MSEPTDPVVHYICWCPTSQYPPKRMWTSREACMKVCESMAAKHQSAFFCCEVIGGAQWTPNGVESVEQPVDARG